MHLNLNLNLKTLWIPSPHLLQVAVLLYDPDPGQHVLPVLGLEQVLALGRGQSQHVLPLGVAVGDVDQTGLDADGQGLLHRLTVGVSLTLLLVLVQTQVVPSQHGVHLLPGPHPTTDPLWRQRHPLREPSSRRRFFIQTIWVETLLTLLFSAFSCLKCSKPSLDASQKTSDDESLLEPESSDDLSTAWEYHTRH